jgi:hypothetical protein
MTDLICETDGSGTKRWRNEEGKLHRFDGPAVEWADGDREWYIDGKPHRMDGPALEWTDGGKSWYVDGKLHRLDGPAKEWWSGDEEWWIDGRQLTEEQFDQHSLVIFHKLSSPGFGGRDG